MNVDQLSSDEVVKLLNLNVSENRKYKVEVSEIVKLNTYWRGVARKKVIGRIIG